MAKKYKVNKKKFARFVILVLLLILVLAVLLTPVLMKLNGEKKVEVPFGESYEDAGAKALFGLVKLKAKGSVDTDAVGSYKLKYSFLTEKLTRTVVVVDTERPELTLLGSKDMMMVKGSKFEEPGYKASDNADGDLTAKVEISGSVDTSVSGEYKLRYIVSDKSGNSQSEIRKVTIVDDITKLKPEAFDLPFLSFDLNPYYSDVICKETEIDDAKYSQLIMFGDSFIEKLGERGYAPYNQLWSRPSTSTDDFYEREIYVFGYFDGESTFFDAMDKHHPENILVLLNSDWTSRWTPEYLLGSCDKAYGKMKELYPDTNFIICSLMPVEDYYDQNYIDMGRADFYRNDRINKMNVYMCELCRKYGFKFMNAAEAVKNPATGACYTEYIFEADGVHLSDAGCEQMVNYIRCHLDW